jgi:hypothetical protein
MALSRRSRGWEFKPTFKCLAMRMSWQPPLTGQAFGRQWWADMSNLNAACWRRLALAVAVNTTKPSRTLSVHDVTGRSKPQISTKHNLHEAWGCSLDFMKHRLGMKIPCSRQV